MTLSLEELPYDVDLWRQLGPVWQELLTRTGDPSAFLSETWVRTWLEVFGPSLRPCGLVWRDGDDTPVACALLSTAPARLGPFGIVRAFLNASGAGLSGCEHNDVLSLPDHRRTVLDEVAARVLEGGVDELDLVGVREGAARALLDRWPSRSFAGHFGESPYVCLESLRKNGRTHISCLSSSSRSQIKRSISLYEERFGPRSLQVAERVGQAKEWFTELVSLHEARWERRGKSGAFSEERFRRFHASLLDRCVGSSESDQLAIDIVRIGFGEEAIGFLYNLRCRGHVNYYQSGFRYGEDSRLKPGLVAHTLAIEHYMEKGATEYDFLGGEPGAVRYKKSLATDARTLAWIQLPAPSPKMRILVGIREAHRRMKLSFRSAAEGAVRLRRRH